MHKHTLLAAMLAAGLLTSAPVIAQSDVEQLRAEFEQKLKALQDQYESRLKEMEARVTRTETAAPPASPTTAPPASQTNFNPEISLVLQGQYRHRKDIDERHIGGFMAGGHSHGSDRGLNVDHTELVFSANVDPYFRGFAVLAFVDEEVEVEEAWFQTLALGNGFAIKGGRFLSGVGYINEQHPHQWDFADQSLMYQVLFGEHFIQDGVQLKWVAPTETYLEFGVEGARGQNFPGSHDAGDRNGLGTWAAFAKIGGDVGDSHSWRAGLNYVMAKPRHRHAHLEDINDVESHVDFSGDSKTWIADFIWKWAPHRDPTQRNFKFQAEYFHRNEDGDLACEDNIAEGGACTGLVSAYRSRQSGWYAQTVYQFMPRWRVGYRYDRLDSGRVRFGLNPLEHEDFNPQRHSLMVDYSPSEYSRLRLQFARDKSMHDVTDNQLTLQYIHSLGSHAAHKF